jgi:hypothetical protein
MSQEKKRKRTPEEVLEAIEEADAADEAERILALSDEEIDRELVEAGFDPEELRAQGRELGEKLERQMDARKAEGAKAGAMVDGAHGAQVVELSEAPPRRAKRARWVVLLAAALAAIAVGLVPAVSMVGQGRPSSAERAAALRQRATRECAEKKWQECLGDLDAAKRLDPAGEDDSIRRERVRAEAGLRGVE